MAHHTPRSLKHEYELYVEREIEDYKDSVPRNVLLSIGDEAVAILAEQRQLALTELVLWEEVDRIIRRRQRIPSYSTWRRRRMKLLERFRSPEHWGLDPQAALVRAFPPAADSHVLVAAGSAEGAALFLAANGCEVTALEAESEAVERVMVAAEAAGIIERVRGCVTDLGHWRPDSRLGGVVCTPAAFAGLSLAERARVIAVLQSATADGGVHLVQTIIAGQTQMTVEELRSQYQGWDISIERDRDASLTPASRTFVARKAVA